MRSSTTIIKQEVGYCEDGQEIAQNNEIKIQLKWDVELYQRIYRLKNKIGLHPKNHRTTIDEITKEFDTLCNLKNKNSLTTNEHLAIEEYKLFIINSIESHIEKNFGSDLYVVNISKKAPNNSGYLHYFMYRVLSFCGILISGIIGFLGGNGLLSLIQWLPNPVLLAFSAALGVVNSILFFAIEANMIKNSLGVNSLGKNTNSLLHAHAEQIDATKRINKMLFDFIYVKKMSRSDYANYAKIAFKFNRNVKSKVQSFIAYKEPPTITILRWGVTGLGAVLAAGNGYFLMTSLLGIVAAPLLGTPVGWAIIGLTIATTLSLYFSIRSKAMFGMVNPNYQEFNKVKNKLIKFPLKNVEDFSEVIQNKLQRTSGNISKKQCDTTIQKFNYPNRLITEHNVNDDRILSKNLIKRVRRC